MMKKHKESMETLKTVRKFMKKNPCGKISGKIFKDGNVNIYGIFRLGKDITMTLTSFLLAAKGLYVAICFILSLDHFDSEIIQHEYTLIHGFQIGRVNIVLIAVVCVNQLLTIFCNLKTVRITGWKKIFNCLPLFTGAFVVLEKLNLFAKMYKTQKE